MSLPDLIEIVPLTAPVHAEITVPGSKSITNRALVLAALADGEVTLHGALWSEDTQVMVECLQELGYMVNVAPDPNEACNRTLTVYGLGGRVPRGGTAEQPLELFVGNAGTVARFLAAMVCLGEGVYRLHGVPRMHERPQAALFQALRALGYRVEAEQGNDKLPATIYGGALSSLRSSRGHEAQTKTPDIDQSLLTSGATQETGRPLTPALSPSGGEGGRRATVSIEDSSQFASALLLGAKQGGWEVKVVGENAEESPYVAMTSEMVKAFPHRGGEFQIEPDASSGSYFWGAGWLLFKSPIEGDLIKTLEELRQNLQQGKPLPSQENEVVISIWPDSHWQIDADFTIFIRSGLGEIPIDISRAHDLGDSIMTAIVLAPFNRQSVTFTELGRLRVQECERVVALRTELTQCGAKVVEEGDTLTVFPSQLHGAEIETYNDHRMAMCFAILGLKVTGIKIKNPACVKKTFPNFFQKLATPPPQGLGATILDGHTGRKLALEELFAD